MKKLTQLRLLMLWLPLVATWGLMGLEIPAVHIMISHLPNLKDNLAAVGVAMSIFVVLESPIFSMLSASTVLVTDKEAYYKMRNFNVIFGGFLSLLILLALIPAIFNFITIDFMQLPETVRAPVWSALLILFPCPFAVGYRRLYQGILVRAGKTSMVGTGTILRIFVTIGMMFFLVYMKLPGVYVGIGAVSAGMMSEAIISRILVKKTLAEVCKTERGQNSIPLTYSYISKFYTPLAFNGLIATATNPLLVFFMAGDVNSLAVFPVVCGITNFFVSSALGLHDLIIANLGERNEYQADLRRFSWRVISVVAVILSSLLFVPQLSEFLYTHIYELTPDLIEYANSVSFFIVFNFVGLACMFWCRAILLHARKTLVVTLSSAMSLISIFILMTCLNHTTSLTGVFKAELALAAGLPVMLLILLPSYIARMKTVKNSSQTHYSATEM